MPASHPDGPRADMTVDPRAAGRTEALEEMVAEFEREIEARKAGDGSGWRSDAVAAPAEGDEYPEGDRDLESEAYAASEPQPSHASRRSRASRVSRRSVRQPSEATSVQDDEAYGFDEKSEASSYRDWW